MKNKKWFVPILILLIIFMSAAFILGEYLNNLRLNSSAACFFLSIFFMFSSKNALKPRGNGFGPRNNLKQYFEAKGMLREYSKIMQLVFVIFSICGVLLLVLGLFGV